MVPSAAIAWYRYHRYSLFQPLSVIILKPVSQRFLKAPLKLITTVLQLLTTDISRNLEFLYSRRTDTHWRAKKHGSSSHRHDHPIRDVWYKLHQTCYLLHSLTYQLTYDTVPPTISFAGYCRGTFLFSLKKIFGIIVAAL